MMLKNKLMKVDMNKNWIDIIFNCLIDGFDDWTLFEQILVHIPDVNQPLICGAYRGLTYLQVACMTNNHRMVKLLIADQHGVALEEESMPIYIDSESEAWIKLNNIEKLTENISQMSL